MLDNGVFCLQKYVENVKQDASIGTNILRVSASDEDADNNGAIVYSLSAPSNSLDLEYFEIQPESGWIVLKKPLDVSIGGVRSRLSRYRVVRAISCLNCVALLSEWEGVNEVSGNTARSQQLQDR